MKYPVVRARAFAATDRKSCGVRAAGRKCGGRRESVPADDFEERRSLDQEKRAATSSRVKIRLKSKPLIRFGVRKTGAKLA